LWFRNHRHSPSVLSLLLAAMVIVPMVSAGDSETTTTIADKEIQAIFDSASVSETLPSSLSPETESTYLEQYVSPARKAIGLMKSKGYSSIRITAMLKKNGYGWDPSTGSCWKGREPTPEEQKMLDKTRGPGYSPFPKSLNGRSQSGKTVTALREQAAMMNLIDENTYFGINYNMAPGNMAISSSGTVQHVATTHVGKRKPNGQDDWTEAGVIRYVGNLDRQFFTFDNDEGEYRFHGTTSSSASTSYRIYVTNTYESGGYLYHIMIGGTWVRDGHLYYREQKYNCANEIWAEGSNPFSSDATNTVFQNEYLFKSSGIQYWGNYLATLTYWSPEDPPYETHAMNGNAWKFTTWA
jgi:hypothetical protein